MTSISVVLSLVNKTASTSTKPANSHCGTIRDMAKYIGTVVVTVA